MKVLVAAAELSPHARSGGLGDAVAGLTTALVRRGWDLTVALPSYRHLGHLGTAAKPDGWRVLRQERRPTVYLYEDPDAFDRPHMYGPAAGESYVDNWKRFGRFSRAVAELAERYDVLHLHDAHTGAAALVSPIPSIFTVHNAAHPVLGPLEKAAAVLGASDSDVAPGGPLEWFDSANYLKAGLVASSRATTVSPGHAAELAVDATSFGLAGVVRSLEPPLVGILNGIDQRSWDPQTDPSLPEPFSSRDLSGRAAARKALLDHVGLADGVVFGNVGRMAEQKGFRLLEPELAALIAEGFRLVLVGNGELDELVDGWVESHPGAVAHLPYDEPLARLTNAGVDAYLMPSLFEPCGLGQMYAMRYGAPPVVRLTGGLRDTVVDVDERPGSATGLGFRTYLAPSATKTVRRAMRLFRNEPNVWARLQARGMEADWSWDARAREYTSLYRSVLADD